MQQSEICTGATFVVEIVKERDHMAVRRVVNDRREHRSLGAEARGLWSKRQWRRAPKPHDRGWR